MDFVTLKPSGERRRDCAHSLAFSALLVPRARQWAQGRFQTIGQAADLGRTFSAPIKRSKNVVQVSANRTKLRTEGEQKGEKRIAASCRNLLLFSGLRRLRQDLVNFISRLEGRRSIQLSYGRSLPNFSYYNHLRYSLPCLFDRHFRYIRYN